ncbi:DUF3618 domain-containing protein [Nonomuraea sp. CA-218870]|uniref:DUF3618 domain-containing protein n=1 Tax=Nonomuraea sp. CA-218870 TaxID=3239998 RepID=UPI003D9451EE
MSETNPGYSDDQHAGEVGSRRATVGTPTDPESINVPPTRPGAAENAHEAEARREAHETFIPEAPEPDDRTDAVRSRAVEEESLRGGSSGATAGSGTGRSRHGREPGSGDDEEERVRASIEETRRELGDTVSALAHKADVKSRAAEAAEAARERAGAMAATAKARAVEMTDTAKSKASEMTGTARSRASEMTGTAKAKAAEVTETAKAKATEVSGTAKAKAAEVSGTATELRARVYEAAPRQGAVRPMLFVAAAGAVVAVLVRRSRRRRQESSWVTKWRRRA